MMKILARALAPILVALAGHAVAQVAFVSDLKGAVQAEGAPTPTLLSELPSGARLRLSADATVSVMYAATGREFVLKGPGEYEVRDTEIAARSGAAPRTRNTEWRPDVRVLASAAQSSAASVRMRSLSKPAEKSTAIAFPAEGAVATLQPVFRWNGAAPANFEILTEGRDAPIHQANAVGGPYKLPVKLEPARDYYWRATLKDDELGSGRFRTLSPEALQRVDARRPGPKAEFSDRLMFALLLQDVGATQEARELWTALARERPGLPELPAAR